jgi:hypothetical protein
VILRSQVDHLVVAAASLDQGIAWCRQTFGFEPTSGGEHPLMGTHNRVFRIDSAAFPRAYLEIIAINPAAPHPGRTRWFDLSEARMHEQLAAGPRLVHFVASTGNAAAAVAALGQQGIDRGVLLAAERPTPSGVLRWKITVREDGQRLFDGALPTLIEWDKVHPCDNLPASGVALESMAVAQPEATQLRAAYDAIGLHGIALQQGPGNVIATLATPRGPVQLESARA